MPAAISPSPITPAFLLTRWAGRATWLLVLGGLLLRVAVWVQARSVYLDEVHLLRNFLERDYAGLFRPLAYHQYAPPLFSVAMKAAIAGFGTGELAIRLLPLLAGCAALGLFAWLALRWLPAWWAALGVATVAFSSLYLDYTTACKQYSTDCFVALALLLLADYQVQRPRLGWRRALGWAVMGTVAVWASMPAVFVLAGVGLALAWTYRRALRGPTLWLLLGIGATWVLSFLLYFKLLLQADVQSGYLQDYHRDAFLVFPPLTGADWQLLGAQLGGLADKGFGKTTLAMAVAAVGTLAGLVYLVGRPSARSWLLVTPLLACLAASALHYYSLQPRLMLFWLPLALLVLLMGLNWLSSYARWARVALPLLGVVVLTNQQRLKYFVLPFQADYADVRGALYYVASWQQPGDTSFIYFNEEAPAYYYLHLHPRPLQLHGVVLEHYHYPSPDDLIQRDVQALLAHGHRRIWVTYDRPDLWLYDWAAQQGTVSAFQNFHEGYAFLLQAR